MRPALIKASTKVVEAILLLRSVDVGGFAVSYLSVRCIRSWRPFLLRLARFDSFVHNTQPPPFRGKAAKSKDGCCREGRPTVGSDPFRDAVLPHRGITNGIDMPRFGLGSGYVLTIGICDCEWITALLFPHRKKPLKSIHQSGSHLQGLRAVMLKVVTRRLHLCGMDQASSAQDCVNCTCTAPLRVTSRLLQSSPQLSGAPSWVFVFQLENLLNDRLRRGVYAGSSLALL